MQAPPYSLLLIALILEERALKHCNFVKVTVLFPSDLGGNFMDAFVMCIRSELYGTTFISLGVLLTLSRGSRRINERENSFLPKRVYFYRKGPFV